MIPLLEVKNVTKSYANHPVLRGISLELLPGDIIGLIGRSGAGKTTLLKILVGFEHPDSGKVLFNGRDVTKSYDAIRSRVGYTTQENSFYEKLTVMENMRYFAGLYDAENKNEIDRLLVAVDLAKAKDRLAQKLSGGMKRRLDFAISLVHNPELIILDEPTVGLDPILVEQFWQMVVRIANAKEKAIIVSSHILSDIEQWCTSIRMLREGHLSIVDPKKSKRNLGDMFRAAAQ